MPLTPETERELFGGTALKTTAIQRHGLHAIGLVESIAKNARGKDAETLREVVDHIHEMIEDGLEVLSYLKTDICTQLDEGCLSQLREDACRAVEQAWADGAGDEGSDGGGSSDEDNATSSQGRTESRKRRKSNQGGREGGRRTSGRTAKKPRDNPPIARKEGGAERPAQALSNAGCVLRENLAVERSVADCKALLAQTRQRVDEIRRDFVGGGEKVTLVKLGLVDAIVAQITIACDPEKPNLSILPKLMMNLARFYQNLSSYQAMVANKMDADAAQSTDDAKSFREDIVSWNETSAIGHIFGQHDARESRKNKKQGNNAKSSKGVLAAQQALAPLEDAIKRWDGSEQCTLSRMKAVLNLGNGREYLFRNMGCGGLFVGIAFSMTMKEAYAHCKDEADLHDRAQKLWAAFHPGERYEPRRTSVAEFIEGALIFGLDSEEHEPSACDVAKDLKCVFTSCGNNRRENLTHFKRTASATLDGGTDESQGDYLGGVGKTYNDRRARLLAGVFTVLLNKSIERRLPEGTLPPDFIRFLLLNPPSRIKRQYDFLTKDARAARTFGFFDGAHGPECDIVKHINEQKKNSFEVGEEVYVLDDASQFEHLDKLLLDY